MESMLSSRVRLTSTCAEYHSSKTLVGLFFAEATSRVLINCPLDKVTEEQVAYLDKIFRLEVNEWFQDKTSKLCKTLTPVRPQALGLLSR